MMAEHLQQNGTERRIVIFKMPVKPEDLHMYSPMSRHSALGLYLAISSAWGSREVVRRLLGRLYPRIVSYLLFRGREVPRDATLEDAVEECPPGGLVLVHAVHGSHAIPFLQISRSIRLEGVGARQTLLNMCLVVRRRRKDAETKGKGKGGYGGALTRTTTVDVEFVDHCEPVQGDAEDKQMLTVRLHNLHFVRGNSARNPKDLSHRGRVPPCLRISRYVRVAVTKCVFEQAADTIYNEDHPGRGVVVEQGGRLEAVDSAIRDFDTSGVEVLGGVAKFARCRINGGRVGVGLQLQGVPPTGDGNTGRLLLRDCILMDNREFGVQLPKAEELDRNGPVCCEFRNTYISKSWYPVAQRTDSTEDGWVQSNAELVGVSIDSRTQFQALSDVEEARQDWRDCENECLGRSFDSYHTDPECCYQETRHWEDIQCRREKWHGL